MYVLGLMAQLGDGASTSGPALQSLLLLYVGPDQVLPLTSALAAVLGVLLMFWHRAVALVRGLWGRVFKR